MNEREVLVPVDTNTQTLHSCTVNSFKMVRGAVSVSSVHVAVCPYSSSHTLKDSESVGVECSLVLCYSSPHAIHILGGHTLAVKLVANAGIPGANTTGSTW